MRYIKVCKADMNGSRCIYWNTYTDQDIENKEQRVKLRLTVVVSNDQEKYTQ